MSLQESKKSELHNNRDNSKMKLNKMIHSSSNKFLRLKKVSKHNSLRHFKNYKKKMK